MRKYWVLCCLYAGIAASVSAQDTIPHIKGTVEISVTKGTMVCDLILSNMPRISNYYVRLNSGMNIRYIKNAEGNQPLSYDRSSQDSMSSGESAAYYLPGKNTSGKYLPHALRINYVGMYPVITDTSSAGDWRGNIAFNGKTIRADGIQSAWAPILYDVDADKRYEKVTYDLDISCPDCKVIYVNGSEPVSGTRATLKSTRGQDLTMFAGDFKFVGLGDNYFLNPDADDAQLSTISQTLQSYKTYFEKKLRIPYQGKSVYIQTTPVSKFNSWLFASYPTIVQIGWGEGMKSIANPNEGAPFRKYMAHELAHYYFGTVRTFNSGLGDMISEGFAEFLSLNITRTQISDSFYQKSLQSKMRALSNFDASPIASVTSGSDYKDRELYVYYYAPIIFSALEKEIGEEKMGEWMRLLLQAPVKFTNYAFFEQTFNKAINDKARAALLRNKYFVSARAKENALSTLGLSAQAATTSGQQKQPIAKTYYYFFFSRPVADIGTSQNRTVMHTELASITATPDELKKMAKPIFEKISRECKNEAGCTSDFNTYETMEAAQSALKRWLDRWYNGNEKLELRILKP